MNKEILYDYWNKTTLGKAMIESNNVSDSDLLFLIPNNVKKRIGLPLTRMIGRKKSKKKKLRKINIMSFKTFDLIEDIIDEQLSSTLSAKEFFGEFVFYKNLEIDMESPRELDVIKNTGKDAVVRSHRLWGENI